MPDRWPPLPATADVCGGRLNFKLHEFNGFWNSNALFAFEFCTYLKLVNMYSRLEKGLSENSLVIMKVCRYPYSKVWDIIDNFF